MTREEWLLQAIEAIRPLFAEAEKPITKALRVSIGFPSRTPRKTLGECWTVTTDETPQIYINPTQDDPIEILSTLVHELCHSVLPPEAGHNRTFAALGKRMGLEGKPTSMGAGAELRERLNSLLATLGPLPHTALVLAQKKVQSTRLLKVACPQCGYTVRVSRKWLDISLPTCTDCEVLMERDSGEEE